MSVQLPAFLGLLVAVAPGAFTIILAALALGVAFTFSPSVRHAPQIRGALVPVAVFFAIMASRAPSAPLLWWESTLPWLLGGALAAQNADWRRWSASLAFVGAVLTSWRFAPVGLPTLFLASMAWLEWLRLGKGEQTLAIGSWLLLAGLFVLRPDGLSAVGTAAATVLLVAPRSRRQAGPVGLIVAAGVAGLIGMLSQIGDLQASLLSVDVWWQTQCAAFEALRAAPMLGLGPAGAAGWSLGFPAAHAPELNPLLLFLLQNGWVGYGLLVWATWRMDLLHAERTWALVVLMLFVTPTGTGSEMLRMAPILGLLVADRLRDTERRTLMLPSLRPAWGPLVRAMAGVTAVVLFAAGMAQGLSLTLVTIGDAWSRQLRWRHAAEAYGAAATIAPQPSLALQRASDLQFRSARFRGADPGSSAEPLMEVLRLGADEGWTLYRLGAIAEFSVQAKAPARVLYRAAAQVLPGSTRILVALGHTLLREGRYDDAVAVFARAVSMDSSLMPRLFRDVRRVTTNNSLLRRLLPPGDLDAHVELARLFEQSGLVPAALSEFESLFDATSPPAWVHVEFARMLARSGRTEMAIARLNELNRWTSIGPQERIEILTLLGSLESDPAVRFRLVSEAFTLLGPAELDPARMRTLLQPLAGDPARQQALLHRALDQLEAASSLRPALIRQRQDELRRVQAELATSPK